MTEEVKNVNFDSFDLEFFKVDYEPPEDDETGYEPGEAFEIMEEAIPSSARFPGKLEDEVDNWTSWKIEDHYYVIPREGDRYKWALFRISWDDNWGRYQWESLARTKGGDDPSYTAKIMLTALFEKWGYDLRAPENAAYAEFVGD